ncbi:MipA/OmpV family protein [Kordiimonas laminariae]|uniref:MipA/OmpV family protein n=1 Tax=Kordiimonas laminariae TaxID=2917717 RepID=UPI001FF256F6|nr:MipA/OmpV family protein [Kordiimonas laminariae]MCK0069781.1 MipA/OmpV family protein [Kordiimonas laminariae]
MKHLFIVKLSLALILVASSGGVMGQEGGERWQVGAVGLLYDSPFELEDTQLRLFPSISYQSSSLYLQGLEAGYHLLTPNYRNNLQLSADIFVAARGVAGQSRSAFALDAGLRARLGGRLGFVEAEFRQDITGQYNGQEVSLGYGYRFVLGELAFIPSVRASWNSQKLGNFSYGVTAEQRERMRENGELLLPLFRVEESFINYSVNIFTTYQITDRIRFIGFGSAVLLADTVTDNPGITDDYEISAGFGVSYSF